MHGGGNKFDRASPVIWSGRMVGADGDCSADNAHWAGRDPHRPPGPFLEGEGFFSLDFWDIPEYS